MHRILASTLVFCMFAGQAIAASNEAPSYTNEDRARIRTELAAEYYRRGQYPIAIEEAKKALAASPNTPGAYLMIALSYAELHDDAMARSNFASALSLAPADPDINHNFGRYLCGRGDYAGGLAKLQLVFGNTIYSGIDNSYSVAGDCATKAGDYDQAVAYLRLALQYRPANALARFRLANLYLQRGQLAEARDAYNGLNRLIKTPTPDLLWLGIRLERKTGDRAAEKKLSEQLQSQFPESKETSKLKAGQYEQ